jgi:hypothetical protein
MPKSKKSPKKVKENSQEAVCSPRIAHVDFYVEKERQFVKYVKYLSSPLHIMWRNFLVGAFQGLGFALGTAILLALIGFMTSKVLVQIPIISELGQAVDIWLDGTIDIQQ